MNALEIALEKTGDTASDPNSNGSKDDDADDSDPGDVGCKRDAGSPVTVRPPPAVLTISSASLRHPRDSCHGVLNGGSWYHLSKAFMVWIRARATKKNTPQGDIRNFMGSQGAGRGYFSPPRVSER